MTTQQRLLDDKPDLTELVREMRYWQKRYFDNRDQDSLRRAKAAERLVDRCLEETPSRETA